MSATANKHLLEAAEYFEKVSTSLSKIVEEVTAIGTLPHKPQTFYDTEAEALGHKNNLDGLEKSLTAKIDEQNPFEEQIEELIRLRKTDPDAILPDTYYGDEETDSDEEYD